MPGGGGDLSLVAIGTRAHRVQHGVHNGSNDPANFWEPTKIFEVPADNEVYISDGYGNRRVIVFDEDTGKFKRLWGAYGNKPTDDKTPPYDPAALEDQTQQGGPSSLMGVCPTSPADPVAPS